MACRKCETDDESFWNVKARMKNLGYDLAESDDANTIIGLRLLHRMLDEIEFLRAKNHA